MHSTINSFKLANVHVLLVNSWYTVTSTDLIHQEVSGKYQNQCKPFGAVLVLLQLMAFSMPLEDMTGHPGCKQWNALILRYMYIE